MKPLRWLPALFLAALAVRLYGSDWLPPTTAEAGGAFATWPFPFEDGRHARWLSALLSALGITIIGGRFATRRSGLTFACGALVLILDPLSLAAGREAGPGGALVLVFALLSWLVAAPPSRASARLALVLALLLSSVLLFPSDRAALEQLPRDASLDAWSSVCGTFLGPLAALLHQIGYSLVPLALIGLVRSNGRRLAALLPVALLAAFLVDGGTPVRLIGFAGAAPILLGLLLIALDHLEARDRLSPGAPLAVIGAAGLVLAVNLPVLVSDLRGGQRFPWSPALDRLAQLERAGDEDVPIYTTLPEPPRRLTDRTVLRLPRTREGLQELLAGTGPRRPLILLLPVEGGRLHGSETPELLDLVEARRVAAFEVRVRRFDLYRYELRGFVLAP